MTIAEILNARKALVSIIQKDSNKEMDAVTCYRLTKLIRGTSYVENEFNKTVAELRKKFGVEEADGNITIPDDKIKEFYEAVNEEAAKEIDNTALSYLKMKVDELKGVNVTYDEMYNLMPFIVE